MSTTAVFVELLVSGIQASIWIVLFVLSLTGIDWLKAGVPQLEKWEFIVTVMVFAVWYTLGIVVDRFARALYMVYDPATLMSKVGIVKKQVSKTASDKTRIEVVTIGGDAYEYLEYFRSRARIVRATVFNTIFTTIAVVVFIYSQCNDLGCIAYQKSIAIVTIIIGVIVFICASIASGMLELAYDERVTQAQAILRNLENKKKE